MGGHPISNGKINYGRTNPILPGVLLFGAAVLVVAVALLGTTEEPGGGGDSFTSSEGERSDGAAGQGDGLQEGEAKGVESDGVDVRAREKLEHVVGESPAEAAPAHEMLRGYVRNRDGAPAGGAQVRAVRFKTFTRWLGPGRFQVFETTSADDGWFVFDRVPAGTYSLTAVKGMRTGRAKVFAASPKSHPDADTKDHEILLKPAGSIAGRVTGPEGKPVAGAWVIPLDVRAAAVRTGGSGEFTIEHLPFGAYNLVVWTADLAPQRVDRVLTGKTGLEVRLTRGGTISGKVTYEGEPMSGIPVMIQQDSSDGHAPMETRSGQDGTYTLAPLAATYHQPQVVTGNFIAVPKRGVDLGDGEHVTEYDLELERPGSVTGSVVAADSGAPLPDAWVCVYPRQDRAYDLPFSFGNVRTGPDGSFRFPTLPAEAYLVAVKRAGTYVPMLWRNGYKVTVKPGEVTGDIAFRLERGVAAGIRVRSPSGEAITGATVRLRLLKEMDLYGYGFAISGLLNKPVESGSGDGVYRIQGLGPGVYSVTAKRLGWLEKTEKIAVEAEDETIDLEITLEEAMVVRGRVVDPAGKGVPRAWVNFYGEREDLTDDSGGFEIPGIRKGNERVEVLAQGFLRFRKRIKIEEEKKPLSLTLKAMGDHFIAGVVRNDLGKPIAGLRIDARQYMNANSHSDWIITEEDGTFRVNGLAEGKVNLEVDYHLGQPREGYLTVPVDRSDVEIVLDRFARVKGRVVDETGQPVPEFSLYAAPVKWQVDSYANGHFEVGVFDLERVPPVEFYLNVYTEDGRSAMSERLHLQPGEVRENVVLMLTSGGSLSGFVRDKADLKPLSGAEVYAGKYLTTSSWQMRYSNPNAVTAEDGSFSIKNLEPGIVNLVARHPDYSSGMAKGVGVYKEKASEAAEILLSRGGAAIAGRVYVNGEGRMGMDVQAYSRESGRGSAVSGKGGEFLLEHLIPGEYEVSAYLRHERSSRNIMKRVTLAPEQQVHCDLHLTEGGSGSLEGTVYVLGEPAEGIQVYVTTQRPPSGTLAERKGFSSSTQSGPGGTYRIKGMLPGHYKVTARKNNEEGRYSAKVEAEVGSGLVTLDLYLGGLESGEITGTVYENGTPLPGAEIQASGAEGFWKSVRADENGTYRLSAVPVGEVTLKAGPQSEDSPIYLRMTQKVMVEANGVVQADFNLVSGSGVLLGKARCNDKPLQWSNLSVKRVPDPSLAAEVSYSVEIMGGEYRIENLVPGRYVLSLGDVWESHRVAEVVNNRETRMDFELFLGTALLEGYVEGIGPDEKPWEIPVYLFPAGACTWEEGQTFDASHTAGSISVSAQEGGRFFFRELSAGAFDLAVLRVKNGKIAHLDKKEVHLEEGHEHTVNLSLQ